MLSQADADYLMDMPKRITVPQPIMFPNVGGFIKIMARSTDNREEFEFDVQRKGRIKVTKCTYQERGLMELIRLEIDGRPHTNPDGSHLPGSHIHTYREGYGMTWATPAPPELTNHTLLMALRWFLLYCKVKEPPLIQERVPVIWV